MELMTEDTNNKALVFEIQKMSTEDGPGIRTTVFLKHCPLKCIWCHNPESIEKKSVLEWLKHKCIGCKICIDTCKQSALYFDEHGLHIDRNKCISCGECVEECPSTALHMFGTWWELEDLFHEVNKDRVYYLKSGGGVTVSGGEPTLQSGFVINFLKKCKENAISTALDTCGYVSKKVYENLLPYVDLILLDIKEIDSEKHKKFTGVSNEKILENAKWIAQYAKNNGKRLWIRTPLIPKYTATEANIKGIGEFIINELDNFPERWDLLSFNNLCIDKYKRLDLDWELKEINLMRRAEIEKLYSIAKDTGVKNVQWSGLTKNEENSGNSVSQANKTKLPSC
jgi:pyruvate formate lyase activating enzyme